MNLVEKIIELGALKAKKISVDTIVFDEGFRKACECNSCGKFKTNYMCPPYVGAINELIQKAKSYSEAVVYQTVHEIEDSYDFEGMMEGGEVHSNLSKEIHKVLKSEIDKDKYLHINAGACSLCEKCAVLEDIPCRFPEDATSSLESYGIAVSQLAESADMKYMNGENTVTYFGAVFLR